MSCKCIRFFLMIYINFLLYKAILFGEQVEIRVFASRGQ